jgi:UDP-GlcNAc:undecaprenyl-phosphate GlcNAc-1-phosphate transferase
MGGGSSDFLLLAVLAAALLGFLRYNFHPASIFLGDSGSQLIGYVLAVTAIMGSQKAATTLPVIIPLLVLGLPIFDTLLSMTRRLFKGRRSNRFRRLALRDWIAAVRLIFQPDRDHVHHRLLTMGFSHRSAVLMLYGIAATLSVLALLSVAVQHRNAGAILLTVVIVTYIGLRKLGYEEIVFVSTGTVLRWCDRIMFMRVVGQAVVDVILISIAYWAAYLIKHDGISTPEVATWFLVAFPFVLLIQMAIFFGLGLYEGVWRAMGIADLQHLSVAAGISVLLSYVIAVMYSPPSGLLSFFMIDGLLLLVLMLGGHSAYRIMVHLVRRNNGKERVPVLIYGAGRRGELVLHELLENRRLGLRAIGFLDDDPRLKGTTINRVRVLGSGQDLAAVLKSRKVSALIVSTHKITTKRLGPVMSLCLDERIPMMRGEFQLDRVSAIAMSGGRHNADHRVAKAATTSVQ